MTYAITKKKKGKKKNAHTYKSKMAEGHVMRVNAFLHFTVIALVLGFAHAVQSEGDEVTTELYSVEGRVFPPESHVTNNWQVSTRVFMNGGDFVGFLK